MLNLEAIDYFVLDLVSVSVRVAITVKDGYKSNVSYLSLM